MPAVLEYDRPFHQFSYNESSAKTALDFLSHVLRMVGVPPVARDVPAFDDTPADIAAEGDVVFETGGVVILPLIPDERIGDRFLAVVAGEASRVIVLSIDLYKISTDFLTAASAYRRVRHLGVNLGRGLNLGLKRGRWGKKAKNQQCEKGGCYGVPHFEYLLPEISCLPARLPAYLLAGLPVDPLSGPLAGPLVNLLTGRK